MNSVIPAILIPTLATIAFIARFQRLRETPTVNLVKRRHKLRTQLRSIVPEEHVASRIVLIEAQRLGVSRSSLEALEAAIKYATRKAEEMKQFEDWSRFV